MKHCRDDYDRIQDPANLIGENEPVFLIRGRDRCAPYAIDQWAKVAELNGSPPRTVEAARQWAQVMRLWQLRHGAQVPGAPEEHVERVARQTPEESLADLTLASTDRPPRMPRELSPAVLERLRRGARPATIAEAMDVIGDLLFTFRERP